MGRKSIGKRDSIDVVDETNEYSMPQLPSSEPEKPTLKPSSSIEAVNLDEWPTSESSPEQAFSRSVLTKASALSKGSAYYLGNVLDRPFNTFTQILLRYETA